MSKSPPLLEWGVSVPGYDDGAIDNDYQGSAITYVLASLVDFGVTVPASVSVAGDKIDDHYYLIDVDTNDGHMGYVHGGGIKPTGSYSLITAVPREGYIFTGWYVDGKQVSTELEYRFRVERETFAVAHFAVKPAGPVGPIPPTSDTLASGIALAVAAAAGAGLVWHAKDKVAE